MCVDVDVGHADSSGSASESADGDAGAAGEMILRCPWRPRGSAVDARAAAVGGRSGRKDTAAGEDRYWGRGRQR